MDDEDTGRRVAGQHKHEAPLLAFPNDFAEFIAKYRRIQEEENSSHPGQPVAAAAGSKAPIR